MFTLARQAKQLGPDKPFPAATVGLSMRVRVLITGRVQGVLFRESTRREADRLGVSGWVRNLPDGRVEALFEGLPAAVDQLVRWCHHGPDGAVVDSVERIPEGGVGGGAGLGGAPGATGIAGVAAMAAERGFRVVR